MGIKSFEDISDTHLDVLKEIANIGSGNAASALSRMLNHPVNVSIPYIGIKGFNDAYDALGGAEAIMVGTLLFLSSALEGMIMFLLPVEVAIDLVNMLMDTDLKTYEEINDLGFSAISEISSIMSASFVGAIAEMSELTIELSPPEATLDMLGSIMSVPSIYFAQMSDSLLLIQNELEIAGNTTKSSILLLPDMPSLTKLLYNLGIDA